MLLAEKKITRKVTKSVVADKQSELVRQITNDKKLQEDKEKLQLFVTLAKFYEEDLRENIFKTSFELDDKYNTFNYYGWSQFKQYPLVRNYTDNFIQELHMAEAQKTLKSGGITRTTDALAVQEIIEGKREADKNTNVIVFLMPQRNYKKVD